MADLLYYSSDEIWANITPAARLLLNEHPIERGLLLADIKSMLYMAYGAGSQSTSASVLSDDNAKIVTKTRSPKNIHRIR